MFGGEDQTEKKRASTSREISNRYSTVKFQNLSKTKQNKNHLFLNPIKNPVLLKGKFANKWSIDFFGARKKIFAPSQRGFEGMTAKFFCRW